MAAKKPSEKKRNKPTPRQMKLVEERAKGKSYSEAAIAAGYPEKNARQSGYQAMQQLRGRVPDLLDRHGLSEEVLIDKYLRPLLTAKETIFFHKDGKVKQQVNVAALSIRLSSLRTAFELHGSYAPKDPKEAAQYGVKIRIQHLRSKGLVAWLTHRYRSGAGSQELSACGDEAVLTFRSFCGFLLFPYTIALFRLL